VFISISLIFEYLMFSYSDNMMYYLNYNWYFWFFMGAVIGWLSRMKSPSDSQALDSTDEISNSRMVDKI